MVSTTKLENIGRQTDLKREGRGDNRPSFKNFEFEKNPNGFFTMFTTYSFLPEQGCWCHSMIYNINLAKCHPKY